SMQIDETAERQAARAAQLLFARTDLATRRTAHGEAAAKVREEETALKELRTRLDSVTHGLSEISIKDRELSLESDHLVATRRERFKQTVEAVNEKFQQIYPRLFGGGRAQLLLTQEGVGQEAGVEIVAQPPGKKLQSVNLLSGGEKALTAVSMIFAIFLIKPT